jgi:nicotinate-nucleotide pyrophosphorylase
LPLHAEAAPRAALLALARHARVARASAAIVASALDAQVAGIDARLAQPGLDAAQRNALWQARVDVLRQAAGFESTQRVLASQGDVGALLVSVD